MPGPSDAPLGNVKYTFIIAFGPISPTAVGANSTSVQTFNVPGLVTTDQVSAAGKPTFQAGLIVTGGNCLTNGVISVQFANVTGGSITPTAGEIYTLEVNRPSNPTLLTGIY